MDCFRFCVRRWRHGPSLFFAHFPLISAFSTRLSSISFGRRGHLRRSLAHKACQPYHVISPWGRADADGGRRAWGRWESGGGAGDDTRWGKIRRQSPCDQRWVEAGNRSEFERRNRGCVCERFLGFMEGMMMSVGGGGRAISKQIGGALSPNQPSQRRLLRLSDV